MAAAAAAKKVLIGGGTGFIGQFLSNSLRASGYEVIRISRKPGESTITWSQLMRQGLPTGCKAVVNLAGQNLLDMNRRWNESFKEEIYSSRINTTESLVQLIVEAKERPEVFVSASAVGYYEPSETKEYTEDCESSYPDFLSKLCTSWEEAAQIPSNINVRQVTIRTGVVLGREGGIILKSFFPFFLGLGGTLGSGKQWFPWIHISDIVGIYKHAIMTDEVFGVLNGTAPNPVTNYEFTKAFAGTLRRPSILPMPEFVVKRMFDGERSRVVLEGQKVLPRRTLESGYEFIYPDIQSACKEFCRIVPRYDLANQR